MEQSVYIHNGNVRIHCKDNGEHKPALILLHGLTANLHSFDGYINAGLGDHFRVIRIDLRGRGLSDQPNDYSMHAHMEDLLSVLSYFNLEEAIVVGHSFGALLAIYTSHHYPEIFKAMIIIDAAARLHPQARDMVGPSLSRLGREWDSEENYLDEMKKSDYLFGMWNKDMESYFLADIHLSGNGMVTTRSSQKDINKATDSVFIHGLKWLDFIRSTSCPTLLINATGEYGFNAPLLPEDLARETVSIIENCEYVQVPGNHMTMLFEEGARATVKAIVQFADNI